MSEIEDKEKWHKAGWDDCKSSKMKQLLSALPKKNLKQHYDDFENGVETGRNSMLKEVIEMINEVMK